MDHKGLVLLKEDGSKYLNQNFQFHRSLGGKVKFLTPSGIQNNGKVGTPFVLKICTMFINNLYKTIL